MIARAEMSTNVQNPEADASPAKGMSVALIGPNDAHRQIVARALSTAQGRKVHEFIDYPADLSDLPGMIDQNFDVVLVDVDTDESYALQIIARLSELGPAVMAYSARSDQELLMSCMRAGARDFLPLPTESETPSQPAEPVTKPATTQITPRPVESRSTPPSPAVSHVAPNLPEPRPLSVPNFSSARSNVTPIVPEKRAEPAPESRPIWEEAEERATSTAQPIEPAAFAPVVDSVKNEPVGSEFAEWDAANLRRAQAPPVTRPDSRPRPSLVPEPRKKAETPARAVTSVVPAPAPVTERPPVEVDIFRSSLTRNDAETEPDEEAERQGAKWIKWILIAAGPLVLALVLLVVFTRPSSQPNTPAAPAKQAAVPDPAPAPIQGQLIVNATGKTSSPQTIAKPTPAAAPEETAAVDKPTVSPDAMAQQLVAPQRIAGSIKRTAPGTEQPPSAPAPVALDEGSTMPSSVFANDSKVRVAPHVVPISAGIADGMIIHKTQPVYPKFAQDAHITGKVVLKATITKQGTIEGVQVISGPKILAPAAVDAVKTWKYRPYMLDNQPVSVETTVTIVFGANGK